MTTSPSYHLLGSADAAMRSLVATGEDALEHCIARTRSFKHRLREALPRLEHLDEPARIIIRILQVPRVVLVSADPDRNHIGPPRAGD